MDGYKVGGIEGVKFCSFGFFGSHEMEEVEDAATAHPTAFGFRLRPWLWLVELRLVLK